MALGEVRALLFGIFIDTDRRPIAFHNGQASLAAQNFNMPALSPTMTEGNIATWKIKEGMRRIAYVHTTTARSHHEHWDRTQAIL